MGEGTEGTTTLAKLAARLRLAPCTSSDTSTIKKATLKNSWALGSPAIIGKTARIIGTAPRNPTQEINKRSRKLKLLKGSRPINTARGRANKIIHSARARAGRAIGNRLEGVSSNPS